MAELEQDRIAVAVVAFLNGMRREHIARHGVVEDCPVPHWPTMSLADRGVLMRAMKMALQAAQSEEALKRYREIAAMTAH